MLPNPQVYLVKRKKNEIKEALKGVDWGGGGLETIVADKLWENSSNCIVNTEVEREQEWNLIGWFRNIIKKVLHAANV